MYFSAVATRRCEVCVYPFRVSRCFTSHPKPKTNKQTQHRRTPSYIYANNRLLNDKIIVENVERRKIHCQVLQQSTVCEQRIELNLAGLRLSLDCVADTIVMESLLFVLLNLSCAAVRCPLHCVQCALFNVYRMCGRCCGSSPVRHAISMNIEQCNSFDVPFLNDNFGSARSQE